MEIVIRLAYGVMIVGIILCFIFSKNHQRDLRKAANEFAFTFVKLSNYISPKPPKAELLTEELPGGRVCALPAEQQPEEIQAVIKRAGSSKSVKLFRKLTGEFETVEKTAGVNRTHKAQFRDPLEQLLLLTHTFLVGCENLETIDTPEKKAAFDSFLTEQPEHRMVLLKRISGDAADQYRDLNKHYAEEMERIEAKELEKKRKGKKSGKSSAGEKDEKGPEEAAAEAREETLPEAVLVEEASPEAVPAEEVSAEMSSGEKPAEEAPPVEGEPEKAPGEDDENLRDKWRGWGCC